MPSPSARFRHAIALEPGRSTSILYGGADLEDESSILTDTWRWNGSSWLELNPANNPPVGSQFGLAQGPGNKLVLFGGFGAAGTLSAPAGQTWEWDGTDWAPRSPGTSPPPRRASALAFDGVRGKTVMFSGAAGDTNYASVGQDTWEWDGTTWADKSPANPDTRMWAAAVYSPANGKVLLFGGNNAAGNDTWEWDGARWARLQPVTSPSARQDFCLVYDTAMGKILLFGGYRNSDGAVLNDTWEWSGTNWTLRTPASSPPARYSASMAHETSTGKTYLFGGYSAGGDHLSDTWEWNGTTWTVKFETPNQRTGAGHAYDPVRQKLVVFGGTPGDGTDTWTYDGTRWLRLFPATSPVGRHSHAMTFDVARGKIILFGGYRTSTGAHLNDTWEWNGTTWTQRNTSPAPKARRNHGLAYDSVRQRVVLFGGYDEASVRQADVWEWDGTAWEQKLATPEARTYTCTAFDSSRNKLVLFGGNNSQNDTWEWDGTAWEQKFPNTAPSARQATSMAYDAVRNRIVLFGGYINSSGAAASDTWTWDGTTWTQLSPTTIPPGRKDHALTYDPVRQVVVMSGGHRVNNDMIGDIWEWNGTNWTKKIDFPTARSLYGMSFDSARGVSVLFGGIRAIDGVRLNDTWEYNGTSWTQRQISGPPVRSEHSMTFDSTRNVSVLFGGVDVNGTSLGDTWEYNGTSWTQQNPNTYPSARSFAGLAFDTGRSVSVLTMGWDAGTNTYPGDTWEYDGTDWVQAQTQSSPQPRRGADLAFDTVRGKLVLFGGYFLNQGAIRNDTWEYDGTDWVQVVDTAVAGSPPMRHMHAAYFSQTQGKVILFGGYGGPGNDTWSWDGTTWTDVSQAPVPPNLSARSGMKAVFDTNRSLGVTFGGAGAGNDTWENNGAVWSPKFPGSRASSGFCYSSASVGVLMFGGVTATSMPNDTWVWNGTAWAEKYPANNPPGRQGTTLVFDSARSRNVLFGGQTPNGQPTADTWEWNGTTWLNTTASVTPAARYWFGLAYDSARAKTVLFGGHSVNDTWLYNGTAWSSPLPTGRYDHTLSYDAVGAFTLLFGGIDQVGMCPNETWGWNGTAWSKKQPNNSPTSRSGHRATTTGTQVLVFGGGGNELWSWNGADWTNISLDPLPVARDSSVLSYDSVRGKAVLFSGTNGENDTWEWAGVGWAEVFPRGRRYGSLTYDAPRQKLVLFGGTTPAIVMNDTWTWNGTNWVLRANTSPPPPRYAHRVAYDPVRQRAVLFGGVTSNGQPANDTWTWNGTNWIQDSPDATPEARYGHGMAFDATRNKLLVFSGSVGVEDTWLYASNSWTKSGPRVSPPARMGHALGFDPTRSRVVLFGGTTPGGSSLNDTWEWDGADWTQVNTPTSPQARTGAGMAFDAATGKMTLFGGRDDWSGNSPRQDTWEYDGTTWVDKSPNSNNPPARSSYGATYDSTRNTFLIFGGRGSLLSDTWEWNGATWQQADTTLQPEAPQIVTSANLPGLRVGRPYRFQLVASGSWDIDWTVASGTLPAGLALSPAGVLSGVPTTSSAGQVVARASNAVGQDQANLSFTVLDHPTLPDSWEWDGIVWRLAGTQPGPRPPIIVTRTVPNAALNKFYVYQLSAAGDPPMTWGISAGTLPAGLALTPTGLLYGTPTTTGTSNLTVQSTNTVGQDSVDLALTVLPTSPRLRDTWEWNGSSWFSRAIPAAPTIQTLNLQGAIVGVPYTTNLVASGEAPVLWGVLAGSLPPGILLDPGGLLSGMATVQGTSNFSLIAANEAGMATRQFSLQTLSEGDNPVLTGVAPTLIPNTRATSIALVGRKLDTTTEVLLGGTSLQFEVVDSTHLLASVPEGTPLGFYQIKVRNNSGDSAAITVYVSDLVVLTSPPDFPVATNLALLEGPDGVRTNFHTPEPFELGSLAILRNWRKMVRTTNPGQTNGFIELGNFEVRFNTPPGADDALLTIFNRLSRGSLVVLNDPMVLGQDLVYQTRDPFHPRTLVLFLNGTWASPLAVRTKVLDERRIQFVSSAQAGDVADAVYEKIVT